MRAQHLQLLAELFRRCTYRHQLCPCTLSPFSFCGSAPPPPLLWVGCSTSSSIPAHQMASVLCCHGWLVPVGCLAGPCIDHPWFLPELGVVGFDVLLGTVGTWHALTGKQAASSRIETRQHPWEVSHPQALHQICSTKRREEWDARPDSHPLVCVCLSPRINTAIAVTFIPACGSLSSHPIPPPGFCFCSFLPNGRISSHQASRQGSSAAAIFLAILLIIVWN